MAAKPRSTGNRGVALLPLLPLTPRKLDLAHRLQVSGMLDQAAQPKSVRVCKLSSVQLSRSSARQSPLRPARPSSSSIVLRYCAKPWSCVLLLTEVGPEGRLPAILPALPRKSDTWSIVFPHDANRHHGECEHGNSSRLPGHPGPHHVQQDPGCMFFDVRAYPAPCASLLPRKAQVPASVAGALAASGDGMASLPGSTWNGFHHGLANWPPAPADAIEHDDLGCGDAERGLGAAGAISAPDRQLA